MDITVTDFIGNSKFLKRFELIYSFWNIQYNNAFLLNIL